MSRKEGKTHETTTNYHYNTNGNIANNNIKYNNISQKNNGVDIGHHDHDHGHDSLHPPVSHTTLKSAVSSISSMNTILEDAFDMKMTADSMHLDDIHDIHDAQEVEDTTPESQNTPDQINKQVDDYNMTADELKDDDKKEDEPKSKSEIAIVYDESDFVD